MASGHGMKSFQDRVTKLEQRHRPRLPGLSSEWRKYLTDKAVAGDQGALQELNLHRQPMVTQRNVQRRSPPACAWAFWNLVRASLRNHKGKGIELMNEGSPAKWRLAG